MTIGQKIKSLRLAHHMTQEDLAEKLFVTRNAISKWEQNRGTPSIDNLQALSALFKVSMDELLGSNINQLSLNNVTGFVSIISIIMVILYFLPWQRDWSMTLFITIQLIIYVMYTIILIRIYPEQFKQKIPRVHVMKVIAFSLSIQTYIGFVLELS
jgi:transcriptional regulator with XRE-family HTH domain